jgi:hypothetical protein
MVYWHFVQYHLLLTELHADAVYVFYYIMRLPEDGGPREHSQYNDLLGAGRSRDRNPKGKRFSAPIQTSPGAHPAYCTMGMGSVSLVVKLLGRDIDHQPPSSTEVKERVDL